MNKVARRSFLVLAGGAGAWYLSSTFLNPSAGSKRGLARRRKACLQSLEKSFSPDIVAHPQTQAFLDDYVHLAPLAHSFYHTTRATEFFILSSNVIAHLETDAPLFYNVIYNPWVHPCGNMLSADWAPEGEHV